MRGMMGKTLISKYSVSAVSTEQGEGKGCLNVALSTGSREKTLSVSSSRAAAKACTRSAGLCGRMARLSAGR